MRSVLNPINIIPTIVRQPIPFYSRLILSTARLPSISPPVALSVPRAHTHTHFVGPALNCLFSTLAPLLDTLTPLDTSLVLNSTAG